MQLKAGQWLIEQLKPGARVLDAGSGTGVPTAQALVQAGFEVLRSEGVDFTPHSPELPAERQLFFSCRLPA